MSLKGKSIFIRLSVGTGDQDGRAAFNPLFLLLFLALLSCLSCDGPKGGDSRPRSNLPPVIVSVKVLPDRARQESELNVSIQSNDPDRDPITHRYQWIRNGQEVAGENKSFVKGGTFKKGDVIQVRVTPSDGKEEGRSYLSASVTILNSPPEIQEIWIDPKTPSATDSLRAQVKGTDPDSDFVYYTFRWEKNGEVIPEENGQTLERGRFRKGDLIAVTVTPDDREVQGVSKKSEPVLIAKSPPIVTSSSPNSVEGNIYRYQVKVQNPDQGPLTFVLKSGPEGMVIDRDTGLIQWEIKKEGKGTYPIEIEVSDREGAKGIQKYTLTVDFKQLQ
jgi:hypothetical protein